MRHRLTLFLFATLVVGSSWAQGLREGADGFGMSRGTVEPGQGPVTNYRDEDWQFWWYLNRDSLLVARQELAGEQALPELDVLGSRLTESQQREVVDALIRALDEKNLQLRAATLLALAKSEIETDRVLATLEAHLDADSLDVRRAAVLGLGLLGSPRALPLLDELLTDDEVEDELRLVAAHAIALIDGVDLAPRQAATLPPPPPPSTEIDGATQPHVPEREHARIAAAEPLIVSLDWHPTEPRILLTREDGSVEVWHVEREKMMTRIEPRSGARDAAWDPAGDRFAVAGGDGAVRVFVPTQRTERLRIRGHEGAVAALDWHPSGARIASGAEDGRARVAFARTGTVAFELQHGDSVTAVGWHHGEERLATGTATGDVRLFDPPAKDASFVWAAHQGPVVRVFFLPDGRVVSAGNDGAVKIHDPDGDSPPIELPGLGEPLIALALGPSGRLIATASEDGAARMFDARTTAEMWRCPPAAPAASIGAVCFDPRGGDTLAIASGGSVRLFDVSVVRAGLSDDPSPSDGQADRPEIAYSGLSASEVLRRAMLPERFLRLGPEAQNGLAMAVGITRDPTLSSSIRALLNLDSRLNDKTRAFLVLSLGRIGDPANQAQLIDYLDHDHARVSASAAIGLGRLLAARGDEETLAIDEIVRRLEPGRGQEGDFITRLFLYLSLGKAGGARATEYLWQRVGGRKGRYTKHRPEQIEQQFQVLGLGLTGEIDSSALYRAKFKDESAVSTRAAMALAMALAGDDGCAAQLRRELRETANDWYAGYVALALGRMGATDAAPEIADLLRRATDIEAVPNAAIALAMLDRAQAQQILLERLDGKHDGGFDRSVLYALGLIGDAQLAPTLVDFLGDRRRTANDRKYAAIALGYLLDPHRLRQQSRINEDFNYPAGAALLKVSQLLTVP